MKKFILVSFISMFILCGCGKKVNVNSEVSFDFDTYQVAEPYKGSVSGNYINTAINNSNDIDNVQIRLMDLSTKYFKTSDYYYQAGQYLTSSKIKDLLAAVNPEDQINLDGVDLKPEYISYIHEQNYLDSSGNLSGMSLGIVLNKYQHYQNSYGTTLYKEVNEEELIKYAKEQVPTILSSLRQIDELKDIRIIVGLYISSSPNALLPGGYRYLGITSNDTISLHELNYNYYYLDSNELMEKNIDIYDSFKAFKKQIDLDNIYISGYGLFYDNNLIETHITINSNYLNYDKLIYFEKQISEALLNNFTTSSSFHVYIKVNKEIVATVIKNKQTNRVLNYIFD